MGYNDIKKIEKDWKRLSDEINFKKPSICELCGKKMKYISVGEYKCENCGHTVLDDYGKVRKFLEQNGPSPSIIISKETGVDLQTIEFFLKKGRLEVSNDSEFFLRCERCGCDLRYGRFCPECTKQLLGGIQAVFNEEMGERPDKKKNTNSKGKLRFIRIKEK